MKNQSLNTNILWNTIGNIFYLGCQWLLSVAVVRISGSYTDAGILTLAISITNIFTTLALFNVRNYQVSDLENRYSQSDYVTHRIFTCSFAMVLCGAFAVVNGYAVDVAWSIIAYMVMKMVEAFADVFHGILQRVWRMDIVGKSCILRGIVLIVSFTISYKLKESLPVALSLMSVLVVIVFFLYDVRVVRKLVKLTCRFQISELLSLSNQCLPILVYGFFSSMFVPTVRFFIERYHGEEMLGYYGSVSTIAVVVQAVFMYVFTPLNGIISKYYSEGNLKAIFHISRQILLLLVAVTGIALASAVFLGKQVLSILFGESIVPYAYLLIPTIFASCLTGYMWFLGMLLIIMRAMKALIIGAAAGFTASILLSLMLIPDYIFAGANIAVIVSFSLAGTIYAFSIRRHYIEMRARNV